MKNCKKSCKACSLHSEITTTPVYNTTPADACPGWGDKIWLGDGQCDDEFNIGACGYDGGDCCGPAVDKTYCNLCICHNPELPKSK